MYLNPTYEFQLAHRIDADTPSDLGYPSVRFESLTFMVHIAVEVQLPLILHSMFYNAIS